MPRLARTEGAQHPTAGPPEAALTILDDPKQRSAASPTAFKLFLRLAEGWGLTGNEQMRLLGDLPRATFQRWKRNLECGRAFILSRDQLERVSLCLGIEKGLKLVFAEEAAGLRWLKADNRDLPFGGRAPLGRMLDGGILGLHETRRYLDAWRGLR